MGKNIRSLAVRHEAEFQSSKSLLESLNSGARGNFLRTLFCVSLVSGLLLCTGPAQIEYALTELQGLRSHQTIPVAINNGGEALGNYEWNVVEQYGGNPIGAVYSFIYRGRALHDLGNYGFDNYATAINNYGQVAGYFLLIDGEGYPHTIGYLHASNGSVTLINPPSRIGGSPEGGFAPSGINDSGVVVGSFVDPYQGNPLYASVYQDGRFSFGYNGTSEATSINNRGQFLVLDKTGTTRTLIFSGFSIGAQSIDIGSISGSQGMYGDKINDCGEIVGHYFGVGGWGNFIYVNGRLRDLGVDGRVFFSLNNSGKLVGSSNSVAILSDGTQDQDLNTLIDPKAGVRLTAATGINDFGQICAYGINAAGVQVGYVLTPIRCNRK